MAIPASAQRFGDFHAKTKKMKATLSFRLLSDERCAFNAQPYIKEEQASMPMAARSSIARLADDAPVPCATPTEMAAVIFVKEMAAYVDQKNGREPMRETQKKVAAVVREKFFDPQPSAGSWPARQPPCIPSIPIKSHHFVDEHEMVRGAYDRAEAAVASEAHASVRAVIKMRARMYALAPHELDAIAEDLSRLPPHHLVTALAYVKRTQSMVPNWCGVGFGGTVPAINLRAALLYARYSRAKGHQIAGRAR